MSGKENSRSTQTGSSVTIVGRLPKLNASNLGRIAAFLVQGNNVLAQTPVTANGFRFRAAASIAIDPCVIVVLGPKGLDDQTLLARTALPRISLSAASAREAKSAVLTLDFAKLNVNDELVDAWWNWCRTYTVAGTLQSPNGCPVPGAEVTVYNVVNGVNGPIETPIETVQTNAEGQFTATFNWCECLCCWPCWPIWWRCWPWWWELDILAVIGNIERQLPLSAARGVASPVANMAPLKRPAAVDLMTGQGFVRDSSVLKQDASRTALIASKFANSQIRELFPWWWWCCDNPNLVFGATQNGNTILNEDPATATRWCFASGQSVTLVGNSQSIAVCPPPTTCEGFAWTSVGSPGTLVSEITNGYANGTAGTDAANMAFTGSLNIYGAFSDSSIPFYQVWAGLWTGNANPARGGVAPAASLPISLPLSSTVVIFRAATSKVEFDEVVLGPCSFGLLDNLYMTTSQRPNPPAGVTGLGAFPTLNPGDLILGWSPAGLIVSAAASALIGSAPGGGVDLTLVAYDAAGAELALDTNNPLTLMIDTTGLSKAQIDSLSAYDASGNPVGLSGSSTTDCPSYHIGPGGYLLLHVTVTDADPSPTLSLNEHVYAYEIDTQFGHGSTSVPTSPAHRGYAQSPSTFTPPLTLPGQLYGVDAGYGAPDNTLVSYVGGGDTIQISPQVSCCYDFQLWAGKRVTDGETFFSTWGNVDFQTATIDVS
jgi:hypothetical protein